MKSQFTCIYGLFILAFFLISNSTNPPDGRTGAPGDGKCTNCHTGSNTNNFDGTLEVLGLPEQLESSTTYSLTVKATRTAGNPIRAGFQLVALGLDETNAGIFANPGDNATLKSSEGRTYFEHNPSLRFEEKEEVSWTVDWTSPSEIDKEVIFYANSIFGNGTSSNGDFSVETKLSRSMQSLTEPIVIMATAQNASCFGENDGAITFEATGGTGNYTYEWSNGSREAILNNVPAGEYTVTVTDDEGVSATVTASVNEPEELQLTIVDLTNINCNNPIGFSTVEASGGVPAYKYDWTGIEGPAVSLAVGEHEVTVTDGNGCTQTTSVIIEKDVLLPQVNAGPTKEIDCKGPVIDLEGGASQGDQFKYLWSTSTGSILSGENTLNPTVEAGGLYTLLVTNTTTGCSASSQVDVVENMDAPIANAGITKQLSCAEEAISLDGTGSGQGDSFMYEWTTADGNITNGNNTLTPTINQSGTYRLKVTDTSTGCTSTATVSVIQDVNMPSATAGESQSLTCNTTQLTLNGNGSTGIDFLYIWETEDGKIESGENTLNPIISAVGTYRLTVRNRTNGCDASSSVTITGGQGVEVALAGSTELNCTNSIVTLNGQGSSSGEGITYEWITQDGNITSATSIASINVDRPGTYRLTVRNTATGCEATDEITVTETSRAPELAVVQNAEIDCENPTVTLQATLEEENENMSIQWQSPEGNILEGESTLAPIINEPGTYYLGVFDRSNNCFSSDSVTVTKSEDAFSVNIDSIKTKEVPSENVIGGMPPFTWAPSIGTDATIMNMPSGEFDIIVTDANGCSAVITAFILNTTSVPSISSLTAINVYPNPTQNGIQLNADFNRNENGNIILFNNLGKQVWQQVFDTNKLQVRIETDQWNGGVYYLMLQTEEGIKVEEVVLLK